MALCLRLSQLLLGFSACSVVMVALLPGFLGGVAVVVKHPGRWSWVLAQVWITLQLSYQLVAAVQAIVQLK